jgi:biotin operon repressor
MRKFGIEIEAVGMTCSAVSHLLNENGIDCVSEGYTHRVMRTWKVVHDISVFNGFEVVSPPLSGSEGIEEVRKVIELLNEAGCDVNRSCGVHVHIDCNDITAQHIANIFNRYKTYETQIDATMPQSRRGTNNQYCKSLQSHRAVGTCATPLATAAQMGDRYHKVNLTSFAKYGTIEFRQHSGSLNRAKVSNWIKFLLQFVEASRPQENEVNTETVDTNLRGQSKTIVEHLQQVPSSGMTAARLAAELNTTTASIQSTVCRLRKRGYHISTGRRYRLLAGNGTMTSAVSDSLFKGIDTNLKAYYDRRIAFLAA